MKKCILSALAGAVAMFFTMLDLAYIHNSREPVEYEHVDFISAIDQADRYLCGTQNTGTLERGQHCHSGFEHLSDAPPGDQSLW